MTETREYLHEKAMLRIQTMVAVGKLRWCDVCGRPFKPKSGVNCYCSFKCRREAGRYRARMRMRRKRCSS